MSWEFERYYAGSVFANTRIVASGSKFTHVAGFARTYGNPMTKDGYVAETRWDGQAFVEVSRMTQTVADMTSTYTDWCLSSTASPSGNRVITTSYRRTANSAGTYYDAHIWKKTAGVWALETTVPMPIAGTNTYETSNVFNIDETEIRWAQSVSSVLITYYTITRSGSTWSWGSQLLYTIPTKTKSAQILLHAGRDVVCVSSNHTGAITVGGLTYWDSRTQYEHLTPGFNFDNTASATVYFNLIPTGGYTLQGFVNSLDHTNTFATSCYDKVYVLVNNSILQYSAETLIPEGIIATVPQTASSNICAVKNKIYVSALEKNSDETQNLWIYDLTAGTWSSTVLPGRHQLLRRHIIDGLDGSVWITNRNNHSIIRVNIDSNAVSATIRVNRHPYRLSVNQSKELFVASDCIDDWVPRKFYDPELVGGTVGNAGGGFVDMTTGTPYSLVDTEDVTDGMITTINQADNSQVNLGAARCNGYSGDSKYWDPATVPTDKDFFDDGQGYIWFVTDGQMGRLKKTDLELKCTFSQKDSAATKADYNMIPDHGTITRFWPEISIDSVSGTSETRTIMSSLVTPPIHYQRYENGVFVDYDVKPYIFIITAAGTVYGARLSALVRKNKYIVRGTAMIAIGDQQYYGE